MNEVAVKEVLGVDIKVLTDDNKEKILRFRDFTNFTSTTLSYDYEDHYVGYPIHFFPILKEIKLTINCSGLSFEVVDVDDKLEKLKIELEKLENKGKTHLSVDTVNILIDRIKENI